MDRIISLLAALVGLIALGGAILVHVNGDVQRKELAAEIADLRTSLHASPMAASSASADGVTLGASSAGGPSSQELVSSSPAMSSKESSAAGSAMAASEPPSDTAAEISRLEAKVAELEAQNSRQASELAQAQARLAEAPPPLVAPSSSSASSGQEVPAPPSQVQASGSSLANVSAASSGIVSASSTGSDCIPSGTRFVGKPGESFAICSTNVVVKIAAIADGVATIEGAGPIAAGSFGDLVGKGCSVMVFSADPAGFADVRVTCK